ncbi:MAG: hypothetical protein GY862_25810, partial [Gammaproteobacteria bacterium]|nr:hypothetical protein [Gammaproteobacteria bacterium]
ILHEGDACWADGISGSQTIEIPIDIGEDAEVVLLALSGATGCAESGSPGQAMLRWIEQDRGKLQFSQSSYIADEGAGTATLTVERAGGKYGDLSVNYFVTMESTAMYGSDYSGGMDSLFWTHGDDSARTITFDIIDDCAVETDEKLVLQLFSQLDGGVLGTPHQAELLIRDNDAPSGVLRFSSNNYQAMREKETASIDVIRENGDSGEVCITYTARAGTENSILHEGDACWADGISGSQTIEIPIDIGEDAEVVLLALSGATGCAESG